MKKLVLLLLFNAPGIFRCYSQNDVFRTPVSGNEVTPFRIESIVEDSGGFIWMGGNNGLLRFDGVTTEYFQHGSDPNSLPSNQVNNLFVDRHGMLWIGTSEGLCRYNSALNEFERITDPKTDPISVRDIREDKQNRLWIATDGGGIAELRPMPASGKQSALKYQFIFFKHNINDAQSLSNDQVWAIYFDSENRGWVGTSDGLDVFDANQPAQNIRFSIYKHIPADASSLTEKSVSKIYPGHGHSLWLLGLRGNTLDRVDLNTVHPASGHLPISHFYGKVASLTGQPAVNLYDVVISDDRFIWLFSWGNGLYRFNEDSFLNPAMERVAFRNFTSDEPEHNSLPSNNLWCGFLDKNDILWIGTEKGIACFHPSFALFSESLFQNSYPALTDHGFVAAWQGNHNTLFLANDSVLYVVKNGVMRSMQIKNLSGTLADAEIMSLCESYDGSFYLGTDMGIIRFTSGEINKFIKLNSYLPGGESISYKAVKNEDNILNMVTDKKNRLWIGLADGLKMYDPKTRTVKNIFINSEKNPNRTYTVRSLYSDDKLWLGTDGGLYYMDPDSSVIHEVNTPELLALRATETNCIVRGKNDEYWIGTNIGLFVWNRKNSHAAFYNHNNGLIADQVNALREDLDGNMWVATPRGFSEFVNEKKSIQNYTASDGLRSTDFLQQVDFRDSSGNLFFGTSTGSIYFNPGQTANIHFNSPVYVTDFKIFDHSIFKSDSQLRNEFLNGKTIELSHNQNFFTFDFTAVDFLNTSHIQYSYKLDGVDRGWVLAGAQRTANYTKIAPGTYTFLVKAGNDEMGWKSAKPLHLFIAPPWWQTLWFRALILFLALSGIFAIYKIRVNSIRRQERHKTEINQKMNELEMTALRAQMNPHFIFNCMNSIQNYILKNETRLAVKYLNQFASLIRLILDNSKNKTVLLSDELIMLESYIKLEQMRLDDQFHYQIHYGKDIFPEEIQIPTMLLQPFIENAIWHGFRHMEGKGILQLHFETTNDFLNIAIEDNGVGREKSIQQKSVMQHAHLPKGIEITKERIAMLNELYGNETSFRIIDLKDKEGFALGTRVELRIPIKNRLEIQS